MSEKAMEIGRLELAQLSLAGGEESHEGVSKLCRHDAIDDEGDTIVAQSHKVHHITQSLVHLHLKAPAHVAVEDQHHRLQSIQKGLSNH